MEERWSYFENPSPKVVAMSGFSFCAPLSLAIHMIGTWNYDISEGIQVQART